LTAAFIVIFRLQAIDSIPPNCWSASVTRLLCWPHARASCFCWDCTANV